MASPPGEFDAVLDYELDGNGNTLEINYTW